MKKLLLFTVNLLIFNFISFACDTTRMDRSMWNILYVDSEEPTGEGEGNGRAIFCMDGDSSTFWHTQWQAASPGFPHEMWVDLGGVHQVNGFSLLTRNNNTRNGRIADYEFYVTMDTSDWGAPQSMGTILYPEPQSAVQQTASVYFGAVEGRYVRIVALNSVAGDKYVMLAEFNVYEDTLCEPSGRTNQVIYADEIPRKQSTEQPFAIHARASSGLPLQYDIVSGPATVADSIITLSGEGGWVVVSISQPGDDSYYPIETQTTFEVINLMDYYPQVETKFTSSYPVEMPHLMPYLLHASASIAEPDFLSISSVTYSVDGVVVPAVCEDGDYLVWWTPSDYGTFEVSVTAVASNGNSATETVLLEVSDFIQSRTVTTLDSAIIDVGTIGSQWYYGTYELPQSVGAYDAIEAYLDVSCPNVPGNCDDWDRMSWIQVKDPTGRWVELIRYVTPYGKACAHHLDVTDFESILQGKVEIRMYIETWGTGGWQMQLDFEYRAGAPEFEYSHVEELWQGTYNFGDLANLQPLDTVTVGIFDGARKAHVRLVTTGHGWGDNNTGNAAEFYHAVHHLQVNGVDTYEQDLWTSCNPNPDGCNLQMGTYKYDRAGWCPGSISKPFIYDVTGHLWETPFQMSYIFQRDYVDFCHPHNPDCVSGVTCDDCNASYSPHYRVSCYLIRESNQPRVLGGGETRPLAQSGFDFVLYPNPSSGMFRLDFKDDLTEPVSCSILNSEGKTVRSYFFANSEAAESHLFDASSLGKGIYFVQIYTTKMMESRKLVVQ